MKRVRDLILARGGEQGIHTLQRVMAVMDSSGDKMLSREELHFGLRDYGIVLSQGDARAVFDVFDRDGSGTVDFDEFLFALRGDLSARRLGLVKQAFKKLIFQWHPDKCPGSCGLVLPPPPPEACTSACTSGCSEDQCNARMAEVSTANRGPPL